MPDENIDLLAAIDAYAAQALGSRASDSGELSRQRGLALQRYAGINLEPAPPGRSQVVDRTVFETVQWIMPSLMRIFAGEDNIVEFDPVGPDDEDIAEQESDYLNYLIKQRNDWDLTVREWCQDALITKNAYCMASMEEKTVVETEKYENQSDEQVAMLLDDDVEIVASDARDAEDAEPQMVHPLTEELIDPADQQSLLEAGVLYEAAGQEPIRQVPQVFDVELKRTKPTSRLRFQVLPPERCRVAEDTTDFTLNESNYFEYWDIYTISELRAMGYDVDDDIADDEDVTTEEDAARDDFLETDLNVDTPDPSMRQVIGRLIWVRFDEDEDGIAELRRVFMVGREILENEMVSRIPVASIVPFLNTHRHIGNSAADLVADIQQIKTKIMRGGLDSLEFSLRPERVVSDKVNLDDMLVSRPGGLKRLKNGAVPGEGHVQELAAPFVFPQAQEGLRHMDTVTEARVGVNRMFQGIDESNVNDHNRIGQLSSMAAQRVEDIARLFGVGFKDLFAIAHELLIKSGHSQEVVKIRGWWTEIDPKQWKTGRDMRVTAPYAAGNKDSLVQRILLHMSIHEKALAAGAPFVDVEDSYNLAVELAKATDLPPSKIYTDPTTVEPAPPPPDHTMIALEVENKKADNAAADSVRDAEIKKYDTDVDAEVQLAKAELQSQTQIRLAEIKAEETVRLEKLKAGLKIDPLEDGDSLISPSDAFADVRKALESAAEQIQRMADDMNGEKEIIRKNGRIVGVRQNGRTRRIKRDANDNVIGI